MSVQELLEEISPDQPVKLYDETEDNRCIFNGYAGEIIEQNFFTSFEATGHAYNGSEMLIWVK